MLKHDPSKRVSDPGEKEDLEGLSSGEEKEEPESPSSNMEEKLKQGISEYEKQRLARIAENKTRMEALGLHKMASSLMGSAQKSSQPQRSSRRQKGKAKVVDGDEDYRPNEEYDHDDEIHDFDDESDDEEFVGTKSSSKTRKNMVRNKGPKPKKKAPAKNASKFSTGDYVDKDDDELMQAIALSLQDSPKEATVKGRKRKAGGQEEAGRRKRKQSFSSRVQMTKDEVILHFFQFDESGRGAITKNDLERMAIAHDFTWTDEELADMIRFFDNDKDGKLNFDDFCKIVTQCNMIKGSENDG